MEDFKTIKKCGALNLDLLISADFSLEEEKLLYSHYPLRSAEGFRRRCQIGLELLHLRDEQHGAENYPKTVTLRLGQLLQVTTLLGFEVHGSNGHWPVETEMLRSVGEYLTTLAATNTTEEVQLQEEQPLKLVSEA